MWYPHVTVATVVESQSRFLMVREMDNGANVFNQPAGHLEAGESLVEAAIRETREETGWLVQPTAVLGFSQFTSPRNGITYVRATFAAVPLHEVPGAELDADIIEAVWLSQEEIGRRRDQLRSPMVMDDIARYCSGPRYPLELVRHYG